MLNFKMKKSLHFFLLLFFILIFSVPAYWLLRGKPETNVSMVEGRVLGLPEQSYPTLKVAIEYIKKGKPELAVSLVWDLYTGGSLQKKFDGAATDQFPFRIPLINFSKSVDRKIISFVYSFSGDKVIPADMTSDIYIILDEQALIFPPNIFDNQSQEIIKERANNYNQIASFFPNINLYLFYLETLEHSQYNPISKYFHNADNG
ncbi:MAG TPA: hypothetical protein DDX29_00575, partial [Clostridiales bacterium]|nr:hypothetical protein [Clostridiales bacterium]